MPASKAKRVTQFTKALGSGGTGGIAGAAGKSTAAYFDAEARKVEARAKADAIIVEAQQKTHQVAISENTNILHELDGALLRIDFDAGTKSKPMPGSLKLSLLGAYGLANLFVAIQQDLASIEANVDPVHLSTYWQDARTPRTDKFRNTTPPAPPSTDPAILARATEALRIYLASNASMRPALKQAAAAAGFDVSQWPD